MVTILWLLLLPHILYCWHSTLQMDWYERRWSKYREWKIYCFVCTLSLTENLTFGTDFTLPFWGLRQRIVPNYVAHVQQDSFSSFNKSDHFFSRWRWCRPCLRSLFSGRHVGDVFVWVQTNGDLVVITNHSSKDSKKIFLFCLKREENTILVDLDCKNPRILYFPPSEKSKTVLPGFWNPSRAFQPSSNEVLNSRRMCQYKAWFS